MPGPHLNKILNFQEYISSKNVGECVITEMWLKKDDALTCKQIPPQAIKFTRYLDRTVTKVGELQ